MATARDTRWALEALRFPLGPRVPAPAAKRAWIVAIASVIVAIGVALGPGRSELRALVAVAALALGAVVYQRLVRRVNEPRAWLIVDDRGLRRVESGREILLADWADGFGATVLSRADLDSFAVALTSPRATRFLPVRAMRADDPAERSKAHLLLSHAITAAESDLAIDAAMSLSATDAERLLQIIAARLPGALHRVSLLDAAGEPVILDRDTLRIGARRIDLTAPVEYRSFAYQELGVNAAWLCQAIWIRQGDAEVFLVAPMPADVSTMRPAHDARLMPTGRGEPPPRELRRAIDHVFMLPLRVALDRAPRISRAPSVPSLVRPEGRV
jgi:hypothetical protein